MKRACELEHVSIRVVRRENLHKVHASSFESSPRDYRAPQVASKMGTNYIFLVSFFDPIAIQAPMIRDCISSRHKTRTGELSQQQHRTRPIFEIHYSTQSLDTNATTRGEAMTNPFSKIGIRSRPMGAIYQSVIHTDLKEKARAVTDAVNSTARL